MDKPSLPKGTRDFGPAIMAKRQFIFNTIRTVFQKYGFQPLETPAMESLETLTGKYGEEGDTLLFRVMDSGDFYKNVIETVRDTTVPNFKAQWLENQILKHFSNLGKILKNLSYESNFNDIVDEFTQHIRGYSEGITDTVNSTEFELKLIKSFFNTESFQISWAIVSTLKEANEQVIIPSDEDGFIKELIKKFPQIPKSISSFIRDFKVNYHLASLKSKEVAKLISEKGLRYDLTVPFARYVVMNRGEITLPFKRYQIQPVWRADRPQRGRYREFYQCDADVVGTDSLVSEAEIVLMIIEVFRGLAITDFTIKINHRGILSGLAELCGAQDNENALFVAIDKLDKIGEEKVREELSNKGFASESIQQVFELLNFKGTNQQKLDLLNQQFQNSDIGKKGIKDLNSVFEILQGFGNWQLETGNLEFETSLARGLSYYTGCIFEVKINNVNMGSVSGGGRYDNLTQAFGSKEKLSGVGISFGIDRIYDVMEELSLFPKEATLSAKVLVAHFDSASMIYGLRVCQTLRNNGIAAEIYPDVSKLKKQLEYADKKSIPFTIVIGPDEIQSGMLSLKNLSTGTQEKLNIESILKQLK